MRVALIMLGGMMLGGCDSASTIARLLDRQNRIDPPKLWIAEGLSPSGHVYRATAVCADKALHDGFGRANPEVNGQVCRPTSDIVDKPGLYAVRCTALNQEFGVTVTTTGDPSRDFTVRYTLTALESGRGPFVQTVRYQLAGACPRGWKIGDEGGPSAAAPLTSVAVARR
jgi:hypothetical protein